MPRPLNPQEIAVKRWLTMQEAMFWAGIRSRVTMRRRLDEGVYSGEPVNTRGDWRIDRESIDSAHSRTADEALAMLREFRA
ncbi:hypothetical protein [Solidesulfovibrio sp.]